MCTAQVEPRVGEVAPPGFPFHFHASYSVAVSQAALSLTLELRNTGDEVQPLDAGWHPYLGSRGSRTICIPAAERWELDEEREPTPTGRVAEVCGLDDFRKGRVVASDENWDDVFSLLPTESGYSQSWIGEQGSVLLRSGKTVSCGFRRWVRVPVEAGSYGEAPLPYMQLYTPPHRPATCLEPLSAVPNAINLVEEGCPRVAVNAVSPGEKVTYLMAIGLEHGPL
jgi:galactose mutarotase-like enzyme